VRLLISFSYLGQPRRIECLEHAAQPVLHVASEDGGIFLVSDERIEADPGLVDMLRRQLVEFPNVDDAFADFFQLVGQAHKRRVGRMVYYQVVLCAFDDGGGRFDFLERGLRASNHVQNSDIQLALFDAIKETDLAQGFERRRKQASADIDDGYLGVPEIIKYEHLIIGPGEVHDLRIIGKEALQHAKWCLSVKGAIRDALVLEVIDQGARDGRLANASAVGSDDD
jgi:hypothetical protein